MPLCGRRIMFKWLNIFTFAHRIQYRRDLKKAQKQSELVARGLLEIHFLAVTFHGRYQLSRVIAAAESGEIELDPIIVNMYSFFLKNAPYHEYAMMN